MAKQPPPTVRQINAELEKQLEEFLSNPPEITSYEDMRKFGARMMQAIVTGRIETKVSNAWVYSASIMLLVLDRIFKQQGGLIEEIPSGTFEMTPEQARVYLTQEKTTTAIRMLKRIVTTRQAETVDVEIEPVTPGEKRIARVIDQAEDRIEHATRDDECPF